jgi:hypothetical protein
MTPQEAVRLLVSLIPSAEEPSIEELYTAMNRSGLGMDDADRAFKFTQIAFGRHFLVRRQTSPPVGRKKAWWQFWA